jgi:hypothetical protein
MKKLVLVKDKVSDYTIVLSVQASKVDKQAAQELRSYLRQITGATLPIVTDDAAPTGKEIILGQNRHLEYLKTRINYKKLGEEGFTIRTVGDNIVIAGGPKRGTAYGIYTFLETHLGVRWYTPTVTVVPKQSVIAIGAINDTQVPVFDWRSDFAGELLEANYIMHNKCNGHVIDHDRSQLTGAHTVFTLLPPEKYFKDHPEYYALRGGARQPVELCLTNPDVLTEVVKNLKQLIAADPEQKFWSVSQMDNGEPCECPNCKAIDDREGSYMGNVLIFANKVAAAIPTTQISTLSYWYTIKPPKTVKPAENVVITFCTDGWRQVPFDAPQNAVIDSYFKTWQSLTAKLYVWDYLIRYGDIQSPFPNWRSLQPNMQYMVAHGVKGIFAEGSPPAGAEFSELRGWVLAKLLWDPNCDFDAAMNDFLNGYYGAAGPAIRKYIDLSCDAAVAANIPLISNGWFGEHRNGYLAPDKVAAYSACFDEAERAVAANPELLLRVQRARMPVIFSLITLGYGDIDTRLALAKRFDEIGKATNTNIMSEVGQTREQFMSWLMDELQKEKATQK